MWKVQAIICPNDLMTKKEFNSWLSQHGYKKLKPLHETKNFLRARIQQPVDTAQYRTKNLANGMKIIFQDVENEELNGEGIISDLYKKGKELFGEAKRRVEGVVMAVEGDRQTFRPVVRTYLEKYGNTPIATINVCRQPVQAFAQQLVKTVNVWTEYNNKVPDELFHLYLILELNNGVKIGIEKNETGINMFDFKQHMLQDSRFIPNVPQGLTLNIMIKNAQKALGKDFFLYSGFSHNCQDFVLHMLQDSGIPVSPELKDFIWQDVSHLIPTWGKYLSNIVTSISNRVTTAEEGAGSVEELIMKHLF